MKPIAQALAKKPLPTPPSSQKMPRASASSAPKPSSGPQKRPSGVSQIIGGCGLKTLQDEIAALPKQQQVQGVLNTDKAVNPAAKAGVTTAMTDLTKLSANLHAFTALAQRNPTPQEIAQLDTIASNAAKVKDRAAIINYKNKKVTQAITDYANYISSTARECAGFYK